MPFLPRKERTPLHRGVCSLHCVWRAWNRNREANRAGDGAMTKYNLPLTYAPKIPKVLSGECRQTIRVGNKFQPYDLISFHGWEGKPYRSPWSFRTPYFEIVLVEDITIQKGGIYSPWPDLFSPWDSPDLDLLARADGIDPPTGKELERVLLSMHKIPEGGLRAQIITWTSLDQR